MMPGGLKPPQPINDESRTLALQMKPQIEAKAGRTFSSFTPVEFSTQVVSGVNYFVKIDIGEGEFIIARIYRDLQRNASVHSVKTGLGATEAITYF